MPSELSEFNDWMRRVPPGVPRNDWAAQWHLQKRQFNSEFEQHMSRKPDNIPASQWGNEFYQLQNPPERQAQDARQDRRPPLVPKSDWGRDGSLISKGSQFRQYMANKPQDIGSDKWAAKYWETQGSDLENEFKMLREQAPYETPVPKKKPDAVDAELELLREQGREELPKIRIPSARRKEDLVKELAPQKGPDQIDLEIQMLQDQAKGR